MSSSLRIARRTSAAPDAQLSLLGEPTLGGVIRPGHVLVVGVEDALTAGHSLPGSVVHFSDDLGVRYLSGWELEATALTPSFWISTIPAGDLDRRVIVETLDNRVVEQDDAGRIWIDDEILFPGALLAFGAPARGRDGDLVLGERAALLLGHRQANGWDLRIHVTTAVMWVFDSPMPHVGPRVPEWLRLARLGGTNSTGTP